MRHRILFFCSLLLLGPPAWANSTIIDFEGVSGDSQPLLLEGFRIQATDFGAVRATESLNGNPSGNVSVFPSFGFDDHGLRISREGGGGFSLLAFDLLEPFSLSTFPGSGPFRVSAVKTDGTRLETMVDIDGVAGPQSYAFTDFHDLESVTVRSEGGLENAALDNVVLAESSIFYPQLALGGGFSVHLLVTNAGGATWEGTVLLDGGAWPSTRQWELNGRDSTGISGFRLQVDPEQTLSLVFTRRGEAVAGWLEIQPDPGSPAADLSTSFFYNFQILDQLADSTGVASAPVATALWFPVERTPDLNTGVAVRGAIAPVRFSLYDDSGSLLQQVILPFDGADFIDQLFVAVPETFLGSVKVESVGGAYVTVIRQEFTEGGGFQLTAVPTEARVP